MKDNTKRSSISIGQAVQVELKKHQKCGTLTDGIVDRVLTNSQNHHHGIKVKLVGGDVGRVKLFS